MNETLETRITNATMTIRIWQADPLAGVSAIACCLAAP
jgi:hypothetical protein